jgi:putative ABC transport system permease protein
MLRYGVKSLWNRRFVAALTILSIALSVALLLGVERLRSEAKAGFANSASGIDLIVAARGNQVQILLATVFGVGSTGAGLSWDSFEMVRDLPPVGWAVPISMGDNHRGFPVIGTTAAYFEHFRHSGGKALAFARGGIFAGRQDAVIGAELAARFDYGPGTEIVVAHGSGAVAFDVHDEAPFRVSGVLEPTGTAVDRMLFVSLAGFDGLHRQRESIEADPLAELVARAGEVSARTEQDHGPRQTSHHEGTHAKDHVDGHADHAGYARGATTHAGRHALHGYEHDKINAVYVGLNERRAVLSMQRVIANYRAEPLTAVLPNVALLELWSITGTAETALRLMAVAVVLTGLIGMIVMLSAALEARRREFGILRSVGAPPVRIFGLIVLEAGLVTTLGLVFGYLLLTGIVFLADPLLAHNFGLRLGAGMPSGNEMLLMLLVFACGLAASLIPAARVYRMTVADGLTLRL